MQQNLLGARATSFWEPVEQVFWEPMQQNLFGSPCNKFLGACVSLFGSPCNIIFLGAREKVFLGIRAI